MECGIPLQVMLDMTPRQMFVLQYKRDPTMPAKPRSYDEALARWKTANNHK